MIARHRGEEIETKTERPRKPAPSKVMVVMLDGPLRCLTPIPRSDLQPGTKSWTYPYGYDVVTYELVTIEDGVHQYRWAEREDSDE